MNESSQPIKIETKNQTGEFITNADCQFTNDYGVVSAKSGTTAMVHRSSKDLDIVCKNPANPDANARAISRVNAGMVGNIIIGGGIGAIIDHNKGTAYTYPTWVQMTFGKTLVFDRKFEKDGIPTPSAEVNFPGEVNLTGNTLQAFEKFKTLQPPKAFVLGDNGAYTYDSGQSKGQDAPATRAFERCEAKYKNCRIISSAD